MNLKILVPVIVVGAAIAMLFVLFPTNSSESSVTPTTSSNLDVSNDQTQTQNSEQNEFPIMETNGVKHLIPLDKIKGGGPPKDGIPSVDNPVFASVDNSHFMSDSDTVIGLEINGQSRAYPLFILVWHEIVNDEVGGVPVSVTYCPLCYTNQVFERVIDGQTVEFGTSGKLYNSNLLMYDRLTDSYWSQALGMAVKGELTGYQLNLVPFDVITWGDWKTIHPDTLVLTTDTGHIRSYATDPYGNYYTEPRIMFPVEHKDDRLHPKEIILGFNQNETYKAFKQADVESKVLINDSVDDTPLLLVSLFSQNSRAFDRTLDNKVLEFTFADNKIIDVQTNSEWNYDGLSTSGHYEGKQLQRMPIEPGFWFEWVAFHPETLVYGE